MAKAKENRQSTSLVPVERIERQILVVRGQRVMLDADLASVYGVATKALVRAMKRNADRFPSDFVFQLSSDEFEALRFQFGTSNTGRGGRRYAPYAFTEHGAVMLASVLNSPIAIQASIAVVRAFVRLRELLSTNEDFRRKLDEIENRLSDHDEKLGLAFDAIRQLMDESVEQAAAERQRLPIGFQSEGKQATRKRRRHGGTRREAGRPIRVKKGEL
jgi:hypothetical protein